MKASCWSGTHVDVALQQARIFSLSGLGLGPMARALCDVHTETWHNRYVPKIRTRCEAIDNSLMTSMHKVNGIVPTFRQTHLRRQVDVAFRGGCCDTARNIVKDCLAS